MKRIFKNALMLFMAVTALMACSSDDNNDKAKQDAVIAVLKNVNVDYWQQISQAITEQCAKHGVKPIIAFNNENADADGQLAALASLSEYSKLYNIKGIILAPVFTASDHRVEKTVADFVGKDIPVVIIDTPLDESASPLSRIYKAYVGTDNKEAGRQLAVSCGVDDASSILIGRVGSSVPAMERYAGFCEQMKQELPYWETDDVDTPENLKAQLALYPDVKNLIFFNGSLTDSVIDAFEGYSVYTFDVYKSFLEALKSPSASGIQGVMAQNTFLMGTQAVDALFAPVSDRNVFITTLYITTANIYSDAVKPFLDYYNIR